ncbi:hypothetical protein HanRHA438_Chr06g0286341 [Helianthus annuus]|nr:hypothetical protein HanRHA438_Chr06g0286341 [Helianthus annuus]
MTSEEFTEVYLRDNLAHQPIQSKRDLSLSKLRESLMVLQPAIEAHNLLYHVWMVEDGVPKSFTKLFTVNPPEAPVVRVRGFRKTGAPMIEVVTGHREELAVYVPYSKHISYLGTIRLASFSVFPYMETLLLLDKPNFIIYEKGKNEGFRSIQ